MAESNEAQVDLREKWPSEPFDFTPWLAENLEHLGRAVGLSLEPVQQEQQIGSFSLDILARETNEEVTVAIENQLEWTDHSHLGQLLTYAAGCDARIAIWVAADFQYEHAEALHKLNQWAGSNIRFYGVKVEVFRSAATNSLKPVLRRIVSPDGWDKKLTLPTPPSENPEIPRYRDFFLPVISQLQQVHPGIGASRRAFDYRDRLFPSSFHEEIGYVASFEGEYAWVYLYIRTSDDTDLSNRLFDRLAEDRELITSSIDANAEWAWNRYEKRSFSTIGIRRRGSIYDPPEQLEETKVWMLDFLPKLKGAFEPRLERLLAELRPDSPK